MDSNLRGESELSAEQQFLAKLLIIGDPRVGKSCILLRFSESFYDPNSPVTVGVDCKTKKIKVDGTTMKLQIWDTAGQERYKSITQNFYKNAMGVLIAFDLTDRKSFENIHKWLSQVKNNSEEEVCKLLVGTKCDDEENRVVSKEEIESVAKSIDVKYIETSAKENINIQEVFETISRDMKKTYFTNSMASQGNFNNPGSVRRVMSSKLSLQEEPSKAGKCCE